MLPLFISLCIRHLYPTELFGDTQLALPNMVLLHTPWPIQILFFGSLLSAIMSTTSSAILAPAAILSENFIKPLVGKDFTDGQMLMTTRLCILVFSVAGTIMACLSSNIYELVGDSSVLSLVSLFVPLTMGIYWRHASSAGALLSMVLGMSTWIIFEVYNTSWPSLLPGTVASFAGMIIGSWVWPNRVFGK
jgi:Na+/proline symporter